MAVEFEKTDAIPERCSIRHKTGVVCSLSSTHRGPHQGYAINGQVIRWVSAFQEIKSAVPPVNSQTVKLIEEIKEDDMPMKNVKIPALSMDVNDCGLQYMVQRHRRMIAERFDVPKDTYPKGLEQQQKFMKMLKASDPAKYNRVFDIIVRGIEPQAQSVNSDDLAEKVFEKAKTKIDGHVEKSMNEIGDALSEITKQINKDLKQTIEVESKKLNRIEHIHYVKLGDAAKKEIKGTVPEKFEDILTLAANRINILLVGPTGCGKTHVSKMVAEALGLEFASQSCSAGMSESAFAGWLLPIADGGKFEYVQSEYVRLYENGGVFLFDEIDAADPNTMLFLNQSLANGEFYLPQRHSNPRVKKHKDFVAIAAANTYGNGATSMYSGRNLMDGATMDRFRMGVVEMDYSDAVESKVGSPIIIELAKHIRRIIKQKNLRKVFSTRTLIDATKLHSAGWSIDKILNAYLSDWSESDKRIVQGDYDLSKFISIKFE